MQEAFLKRLKIRNFKSFVDLDVEFKKFNVLVGANAAGKSNFAQIFKFMKDVRGGLADALAMQGGAEYMLNFDGGNRMSIELEIDFPHNPKISSLPNLQCQLYNTRAKWNFELEMGKRTGFKILSDAWRFYTTGVRKQNRVDGALDVKSENGKISLEPDFSKDVIAEKTLSVYKTKIPKDKSILESHVIIDHLFPWVGRFFDELETYNFSPNLSKRPSAIGGRIGLEPDGSNLPIVLRGIVSNSEKKRKFVNLASYVLPFVKSFGVKNIAGKSLMFMIEERYSEGRELPADLASDGTASAMALIVALHFQDARLAVIEEPERHVHPALLSGMVHIMKDASSNKQVVVTTHSPEIVRQSGIENLLLISRPDSGSSRITRPSEEREVQSFLESEMDIGEMHVQGLLGD